MITVWIEDTSELSAPGPQDFVEALEALGLSFTQSLPTTDAVGLLFAPLSHPIIEGLPTSKRARTILVSTEVESPHADSTRRRLGLSRSQHGQDGGAVCWWSTDSTVGRMWQVRLVSY